MVEPQRASIEAALVSELNGSRGSRRCGAVVVSVLPFGSTATETDCRIGVRVSRWPFRAAFTRVCRAAGTELSGYSLSWEAGWSRSARPLRISSRGRGTRTLKALRPTVFETVAYTNSATPPWGLERIAASRSTVREVPLTFRTELLQDKAVASLAGSATSSRDPLRERRESSPPPQPGPPAD